MAVKMRLLLSIFTLLFCFVAIARGRIPGVYGGGPWETAHAAFYGGNDASGTMVATIYAGGDEAVGHLIAEAIAKAGNYGVDVEELDNLLILIHPKEISSKEGILKFLDMNMKEKRALLIVAENTDSNALEINKCDAGMEHSGNKLVKDDIVVGKNIAFDNRVKNFSATMPKSGTCATVLKQKIFSQVCESFVVGDSVAKVTIGMRVTVEKVVQVLNDRRTDIEKIDKVATIYVGDDEAVGHLIAEVIGKAAAMVSLMLNACAGEKRLLIVAEDIDSNVLEINKRDTGMEVSLPLQPTVIYIL
ncbi:hypothetical protein F511_37942 [Dorcoceras hygrometricum]|uniref:Uncharacterized protein n=1 Tax=Dorcoceras hygrometricum TaxID=472368 RepID=A0A2Z7D6H0_9LAMI|nr:hypothetical protein F511_37942 [Dorcoceras hygrometricum]